MGDPIVTEQKNAREKETSVFTEAKCQAPLTCPPCLLSELTPCVPESKRKRAEHLLPVKIC